MFTGRGSGEWRWCRGKGSLAGVHSDAITIIRRGGGLATAADLLTAMTRQQLDVQVRKGNLIRVWRGVYSTTTPDLLMRLRALDMLAGERTVSCMHTAAELYGFSVNSSGAVHVLDPGFRLRPTAGLVVHQRRGAPLQLVSSRRATSPAWTAVELARQLRPPRALATLDAALHSRRCTPAELAALAKRLYPGEEKTIDTALSALTALGGANGSPAIPVRVSDGVPTLGFVRLQPLPRLP